MIVRDFNNGWGDGVELRRFEQQILARYLDPWYRDDVACVTVNSTWYSEQYHAEVSAWLRENPVQRIALISFMDPAIPKKHWFHDIDAEIRCVGYYQGRDELDVWALIMHHYFQIPNNITSADLIDQPFLCYNRKPHWHRRRLLAELRAHDCVDRGIVTMGHATGQAELCLTQDVQPSTIAPNPGAEQYGIVNDIMSLGPLETWQRCLLNVVTETVYDVDKEWFVSEKIYKPILGQRPFLVYAPNGARSWLQHLEFLDFTQDFKDITDLDLACPDNIAPFLAVLCAQPPSYLRKKYLDLWPKMCHNHDRFQQHVIQTQQRVDHAIQP